MLASCPPPCRSQSIRVWRQPAGGQAHAAYPRRRSLNIGGERLAAMTLTSSSPCTICTYAITRDGNAINGVPPSAHLAGDKVMSTPLPLYSDGTEMRMCIVDEGWSAYPTGVNDCATSATLQSDGHTADNAIGVRDLHDHGLRPRRPTHHPRLTMPQVTNANSGPSGPLFVFDAVTRRMGKGGAARTFRVERRLSLSVTIAGDGAIPSRRSSSMSEDGCGPPRSDCFLDLPAARLSLSAKRAPARSPFSNMRVRADTLERRHHFGHLLPDRRGAAFRPRA